FQYIHARYNPENFDEFWEEWGNKQNDAVGAILYQVGQLEKNRKGRLFENKDRVRIVQKLVYYLQSIEYWHDKDSGMWEEDEEIHASSVGACVAGLKVVDALDEIEVPDDMILKGEESLNQLLPRESARKFTDLALLSLIYPYRVVTKEQQDQILENIEYHLLKERGVIRYKGDMYYNGNPDGYSEEAEWTFGLAWLSIIYKSMGNEQKAQMFLDRLIHVDTAKGMPELYFSNMDRFNENTPLGWSESLFIVALYEMNEKRKNST
ncbi:glycoside hydrolase family 15, partial [Candidatus Dojkabacteria bacterium]|nr:glycoside hydrolase family 15 [Candidatus Dojkabacteria bacterium]